MAWKLEEREYENHPEGVFVAELVMFTDEGEVETQYGTRHRGFYELQTGQVSTDGQPLTFRLYVYASASERARMTELRNACAGRKLSKQERVGEFDPDSLLGQKLQVQLVHNTSGDKTYVNVESMMPLPQGGGVPTGATQTAAQEQNARWNTAQGQQQGAQGAQQDDSDLPF